MTERGPSSIVECPRDGFGNRETSEETSWGRRFAGEGEVLGAGVMSGTSRESMGRRTVEQEGVDGGLQAGR